MMGAIVLLHRWLGIAFCLLFAMWFASGIVMHFVPFPSLTDAERFAGLAPGCCKRLDASRRAYRWLYSALHTLDFPILMAHPHLRDVLIVGLCTLGLAFSVTGIVIGWRRVRLPL